jgi:hypothetical protein
MPNPFSPLQGYDLPTAVQRILEEIDGAPPAPAHFADERPTPGTLTVQPDNRGPAAIVVGLTLKQQNGSTGLDYSADIQVKGVTLIEGELPAFALRGSSSQRSLLSPIRLDSKTPMKVQVSMLTGQALLANVHRLEIQVLYGSVAACDEVMRRMGQARWWSFYGPVGADLATGTLTVEIGGRPTYAQSLNQGDLNSTSVSLDGLSLMPFPVQDNPGTNSFLPHAIQQAQVYAYALATANASRAFWAWQGPSDDY